MIVKKLLAVLIALGIILGIGGISVFARGYYYVDRNNDGICDHYPNCHHANYVDDNDAINYRSYHHYEYHGHHGNGHHCH